MNVPIHGDDASALLLAEANHRFFNSLQVLSALAARCDHARTAHELKPILSEFSKRIGAFATVHRALADPINPGALEALCCDLVRSMIRAFGRRDAAYVDMDCRHLTSGQTDRVALVVAELVTNALKHSLHGHPTGAVCVVLRTIGDNQILTVSDTAETHVATPAPAPSRIVSALASSLYGHAHVIDRNGYAVQVSIPISEGDDRNSGNRPPAASSFHGAIAAASRRQARFGHRTGE